MPVILCRSLDCRYQGRHTADELAEFAKPRKPGPKGKLTADKVMEIRKQLAAKVKYKSLANQYDVSVATIEKIALRQTWRYI